MPTPFPNHPNYVGYDAYAGNPRAKKPKERTALLENLSPLTRSDLPDGTPKEWLSLLEAVRLWAIRQGLAFSISPFEYQIAKITGDVGTIVLWNARKKPGKSRWIKASIEGPPRTGAHEACAAIQEIVRI